MGVSGDHPSPHITQKVGFSGETPTGSSAGNSESRSLTFFPFRDQGDERSMTGLALCDVSNELRPGRGVYFGFDCTESNVSYNVVVWSVADHFTHHVPILIETPDDEESPASRAFHSHHLAGNPVESDESDESVDSFDESDSDSEASESCRVGFFQFFLEFCTIWSGFVALIAWLVGLNVEFTLDRLIDWLSIHWLIECSIDWLIYLFVICLLF